MLVLTKDLGMTTSVETREKYSMQDAIAIFLKFVILICLRAIHFGVASDVNRHFVGTILKFRGGGVVAIVIPPVAVIVSFSVPRAALLPV